jgi:hypothetical protein
MSKFEKLVVEAKTHLEAGEEVEFSVFGAYESKIMGKDTVRNGVFLATSKRIVFFGKKMFGYDLEVFPYSNISSIEMGKGMMGHTISFFSSGNAVKMKWINSGDIPGFVNHVKGQLGKKSEGSSTVVQQASAADELKKFAELRDLGILTDEEFNEKKKQLLGI